MRLITRSDFDGLACGALLLEALKQIIWSYSFDPAAGTGVWDYQWYAFPFQLCTTPIFVSLICAFLKKGPARDRLLSFLAFVSILGSLATALYPESCFVSTVMVDLHTMYLHFGSLVVSVYLLTSGEIRPRLKNLLRGYGVFLVFAALAELLNLAVYHSGVLQGESFNMFYISPWFPSSLPVFSSCTMPLITACWAQMASGDSNSIISHSLLIFVLVLVQRYNFFLQNANIIQKILTFAFRN